MKDIKLIFELGKETENMVLFQSFDERIVKRNIYPNKIYISKDILRGERPEKIEAVIKDVTGC